jgi:hypothetical protein
MNKTQKLLVTIEDITIETTFDKLPKQVLFLVPKLEAEPAYQAHGVVLTSGNATLYVALDFVGKRPKAKVKIFGQEQEEFMARQYK